MELRKVMPATAMMAAGLLLAAGCGGTLEGKYRRGQLTPSTTAPSRSTGTGPGSGAATSSTTTTSVPTAGNAAGQRVRGEPGPSQSGGTIEVGAAWRHVVSPFGGRHR